MIYFAKPVLTEDFEYSAKGRIFNNMLRVYVRYVTLAERPSIFIRGELSLSSERMLHKAYSRKGSVLKIKFLVVGLKVLDTKTNFTGAKPPVVKYI
jgi:hypothetical protein